MQETEKKPKNVVTQSISFTKWIYDELESEKNINMSSRVMELIIKGKLYEQQKALKKSDNSIQSEQMSPYLNQDRAIDIESVISDLAQRGFTVFSLQQPFAQSNLYR